MKYRHIAICGFMGAGKSTVSARLAKMLGIDFVDTDKIIKGKRNTSISEIFKKYGEEGFRYMEFEIAQNVLAMKKVVISTGGGMLTQKRVAKLFKENSVIIVYLKAPFDVLYDRIINRRDRPLVEQNSKEELFELYCDRCEIYEKLADFTVDATLTPEMLCRIIKRDLSI